MTNLKRRLIVAALFSTVLAALLVGLASAHIGSLSATSSSTSLAPGDVFTVDVTWTTNHNIGVQTCFRIAQRTATEGWTSLLGIKLSNGTGTRAFTLTEPAGFTPGPGTIRVTVDNRFGGGCNIPAPGAGSGASRRAVDIAVTKVAIADLAVTKTAEIVRAENGDDDSDDDGFEIDECEFGDSDDDDACNIKFTVTVTNVYRQHIWDS